MQVRLAVPADSAALLRVYGQYIDTPITFEYALPSEAEFAARIAEISRDYPYLVCTEDSGQIIGFSYAHRPAERAAYQWDAELSIYLDRNSTSRGLGRRLYGLLFQLLRLQGIRTVYGSITLPNAKSEGLHRKLGFQPVGVFHNTGWKNGQWWDVIWLEKPIAPYDAKPEPLRSIRDIPPEQIAALLRAAEAAL